LVRRSQADCFSKGTNFISLQVYLLKEMGHSIID